MQAFPFRRRLGRIRCAAVLAGAAACSAAAPAGAVPLISEVFYDAVGADDGQSFIELFGATGASLDGLQLELVNGDNGAVVDTLVLTGVFGPDGLFVVADRTSAGATGVADADLLLDFDPQNGPDSVVLRDDASVLDAVGYGTFGPGLVFAGEGSPAPDVSAGASLARWFANVDTDDNATDFHELAAPTPGVAALAAVPEPGPASLCALGLAGLAARRRSGGRAPGEGAVRIGRHGASRS